MKMQKPKLATGSHLLRKLQTAKTIQLAKLNKKNE